MSGDLFAPEGGWRVRILDLSGGAADVVHERTDRLNLGSRPAGVGASR